MTSNTKTIIEPKAKNKIKAKLTTKNEKVKLKVIDTSKMQHLLLEEGKGKSKIKLDYMNLRKAALTLRALNHPLRKRILKMIEEKEKLTVTDIYHELSIEQSVTSQHLGILRKANVVVCTRGGKFVYYSVNKKRVKEITFLINDLAKKI